MSSSWRRCLRTLVFALCAVFSALCVLCSPRAVFSPLLASWSLLSARGLSSPRAVFSPLFASWSLLSARRVLSSPRAVFSPRVVFSSRRVLSLRWVWGRGPEQRSNTTPQRERKKTERQVFRFCIPFLRRYENIEWKTSWETMPLYILFSPLPTYYVLFTFTRKKRVGRCFLREND